MSCPHPFTGARLTQAIKKEATEEKKTEKRNRKKCKRIYYNIPIDTATDHHPLREAKQMSKTCRDGEFLYKLRPAESGVTDA